MASTIITSVVSGGSNNHATTAAEVNGLATDFITQGTVGSIGNTAGVGPSTGSFAVNAQASPAMFVDVTAGTAYITATPTGQASQALRAYMASTYTSYAISSNASGSTKYDWIYLIVTASAANNPASDASDVSSLFTSRSSSVTTDNGSPPTYGILLAVVTVANGASSIANASIQDRRTQSTLNSPTTAGWTLLGNAPSTVSALGNRSYSCVFNSVDLTSTLSAGMRLRLSRTIAAPTQCTSLNGTTQYYSKSSPSAMTFTDDFVVSGWVKLNSYGNVGTIASRYNGTSGWDFNIQADGRVALLAYNAGAANNSFVISYQSIPLNKWVHVAAQLDMSTFTATTITSYIMLDGVDATATVARNGTNPTALIQAGNLEIGSRNAGTQFFPGKLAQVAIYNAKVTQATVLASIDHTLSGSETSLISAYSFNNTINDLSSSANNLTAQGSAVATNADSPFGGQADGTVSTTYEYAQIISCSFSTNTTVVIKTTDFNVAPTTGGISAVSYSAQASPYNMPALSKTWGYILWCTSQTTTATATGTALTAATITITLPVNKLFVLKMFAANINAAAGVPVLDLYSGATQVSRAQGVSTTITTLNPISPTFLGTGSSQTFTVNMWESSAGTCTITANTTTPAFFSLEEG